ncbi:MAG: DUF2752 domain-containing protein [Planctomycetes bacterium]|nr:DUF2752 domain-containing protein [Planctomycetota bacterium]
MTPQSSTRDAAAIRRGSAAALIVFLGVLALGLSLNATVDGATLGGVEGPDCLIRSFAGERACPGCGLTRSLSLILHGHFFEAWTVNAGGFFLVGVLAFWSYLHSWMFVRGERTLSAVRWLTHSRRFLLLGVILGWVLRWV